MAVRFIRQKALLISEGRLCSTVIIVNQRLGTLFEVMYI